MKRFRALLLACLPLTLAGCLIPQPDTPPVIPGAPKSSQAGVMKQPPSANPEPRASATQDTAIATPATASSAPQPEASSQAGGGTNGLVPPFSASPSDPQATTVVDGGRGMTPGQLTVNFSGLVPKEVWLVAVDGSAVVGPKLDADGFAIGLAPGDYWLEIVEAGQRLRSRTPLTVSTGAARTLEVAVEADKLVIEETVALDVQPTPVPTATASPTP